MDPGMGLGILYGARRAQGYIDIHRGSGHRARQNLHLRLDWVQCVNS